MNNINHYYHKLIVDETNGERRIAKKVIELTVVKTSEIAILPNSLTIISKISTEDSVNLVHEQGFMDDSQLLLNNLQNKKNEELEVTRNCFKENLYEILENDFNEIFKGIFSKHFGGVVKKRGRKISTQSISFNKCGHSDEPHYAKVDLF
jgi:N12 class adenine-specific DNA methylase